MSEHDKHTEFLKRCIYYDESAGCQQLATEIQQIQRDSRCVHRAVWLMAILSALIVAGLGYLAILLDNFPYNAPQFVINLMYALGLGSVISLLAFWGLGLAYRWKLDGRREECRQRVAKLLESRLGNPATTSLPDNPAGEEATSHIRELIKIAQGSKR